MLLFIISFVTLALLFILEYRIHLGRLKKIPIRITVSGTRGKSSLARLVAAALRERGMKVVAKTTGSEAAIILPDGTEERVSRRGIVSISEQKDLVRKAALLDADCLVAEVMSINPENHRVETRKLLQPSYTLFTNFRADHTDLLSLSRSEASLPFKGDLYPNSTLILPADQITKEISVRASKLKIRVVETGKDGFMNAPVSTGSAASDLTGSLSLTEALLNEMGIEKQYAEKGLKSVREDIGATRLFRMKQQGKELIFAATFAANDPESTRMLVNYILTALSKRINDSVAILSLRDDRGERSRQWFDCIKKSWANEFMRIWVTGRHGWLFSKRLSNCINMNRKTASEMTDHLFTYLDGGTVVFGLANISGPGEKLLDHWKENGEELFLNKTN